MGYIASSRTSSRSSCLLFAWVMVLLAFFILAIQLFVTLIEFKLTTLAGFVLVPFGLFGKTAFLAERVLGNVVSSGVKVLVLAVIVGIGSTLFAEFTRGFGGNQPTIEDAMAIVLAALSLLGLGIFGPGIANGLVSGGPQLGAGAPSAPASPPAARSWRGGAAAGMAARGAEPLLGATAAAARGGAAIAGGASTAYGARISRTERRGRRRIGSRRCRARRRGAAAHRRAARGGLGRAAMAESYRRRRASRRRSDRRHIDHGHDRRRARRAQLLHATSVATRLGAAHEAPPDHEPRRHRRRPRRPLRRQPRRRRLRHLSEG